MNKKFKKGQAVIYDGEKYEFIEYDPTSPTGVNQRVLLKKEGVEATYGVLERELNYER